MSIKNAFSFILNLRKTLRFLTLFLVIAGSFVIVNPANVIAADSSTSCPASDPYCFLPAAVAPENINWEQFNSWPKGAQQEYSRRVANYEREKALASGATLNEARKAYEEAKDKVDSKIKDSSEGDDCEDPKSLIDEYTQVCNTCVVFGEVFNALSTMSERIYDAVAPSAAKLIGACLLVWLAFHIMKAVSSVAPIEPGEFWKTATVQVFTAAFAYFALTTGTQVYGYLMEPIISGGFDFATIAIRAASGNGNTSLSCTTQSVYGGGIFTEEMHQSLDCLIQEIQNSLAEVRALGVTLMCVATTTGKGSFGIPDIAMWASGGVIWIIVMIMLLAVPFYLFDSLIRFGVVGAMLPLLIAAWAFQITRSFATKGFNMLLHATMSFIAVTIIVAIDIQLVVSIFEKDENSITTAINSGSVSEIKDMFDFGGFRFLLLLACGFFAVKLLGKASEIAAHFGNAQFTGAAPMIGGMMVNGAKSVAKSAGTVAGAAVINVGGAAIKAGGKVAYNRFSRTEAGQKVNSFGRKMKNWGAGGDFKDPMAQNKKGDTAGSGNNPANLAKDATKALGTNDANKAGSASNNSNNKKADNFEQKQSKKPNRMNSKNWRDDKNNAQTQQTASTGAGNVAQNQAPQVGTISQGQPVQGQPATAAQAATGTVQTPQTPVQPQQAANITGAAAQTKSTSSGAAAAKNIGKGAGGLGGAGGLKK
ncbi:MAG: hypothetical protein AB7U85_03425 [Alphaproteobacteria bacterium]